MALTGQDLLRYLELNKGQPRDEVIKGAGYTTIRGGKETLQKQMFFDAMAEAHGHELVTPESSSEGKGATYRLKVGPRGLIPVGGFYSRSCSMEPGSYVKVVLEDGAIILEPDTSTSAPAAPTAQLASVA